jgi:hypothetical protein
MGFGPDAILARVNVCTAVQLLEMRRSSPSVARRRERRIISSVPHALLRLRRTCATSIVEAARFGRQPLCRIRVAHASYAGPTLLEKLPIRAVKARR